MLVWATGEDAEAKIDLGGADAVRVRHVVGDAFSSSVFVATKDDKACERHWVDKDTTTRRAWRFTLPDGASGASAVAFDAAHVYCRESASKRVHVLDRSTGALVRTIRLRGGSPVLSTYSSHVGFAVVANKVYLATGSSDVYRYDVDTGDYDGYTFDAGVDVTIMLFLGRDLCVGRVAKDLRCFQVR